MYIDPALVLACDLPIGWCPDAESSLFRIVFRPWDRRDERIIFTVVPHLVMPAASGEEWAEAISLRLGLRDSEILTLAVGAAITGLAAMDDGRCYRRIAVRGPVRDVIADHVHERDVGTEISPILLRIAASARTPARQPLSDRDADSLEAARASVDALPEQPDAAVFFPAYERLESAGEEQWVSSLAHGDQSVDLNALESIAYARVCLGQSPSRLLSLSKAHALLLRAVPRHRPTEPYIRIDECLRPALAARCKDYFDAVPEALRRLELYKDVPAERWGREEYIQQQLGCLIIEEVRSAYEHGARPSSEAALEGLMAQLCAYSAMITEDSKGAPPAALAEVLLFLGRAITAYTEAAQREDDLDTVVEAAEYLTNIGGKLFAEAATAGDEAGMFRSQGATFALTGICSRLSALNKTADQASLEETLRLIEEEAPPWLRRAPGARLDHLNLRRNEALAALQLGDIARARRAAARGKILAKEINEKYQIGFFDWIQKVSDALEPGYGVVRTIPDLHYALAKAEGRIDALLPTLCETLERELADDPSSATNVEWLLVAAHTLNNQNIMVDGQILDGEEILAAVDGLLDLKRLLVSGQRGLQLGADDSLIARRVGAGLVSHKIQSEDLIGAVSAADRARARSLLLDFTLLPGQTADLREAMRTFRPPGASSAVAAMLRDAAPPPFRLPSRYAGPLGEYKAARRIRDLGEELRTWVSGLTNPIGTSPLTPEEILKTAAAHREPILVLHPAGERLALFLITPQKTVHHAWSAGSVEEVFDQAQQFHSALAGWVSTRQRGEADWSTASRETDGASTASAALYRSLIEPVREYLAGYTRLTIVPYRELGSLPFALLEDEHGDPLITCTSISMVPSIASLNILKHRTANPVDTRLAYVVGDPATPLVRERLPGAAAEVRIIRDRLAAAHPEISILLRTDVEATPANYVKEASGARLVHLACHAGVGTRSSNSTLYFAPGPDGESKLQADKIISTPLGDSLVFLAACRSGAGRATADGTVGLAREFLRAGARAVVASYWKVSDEATLRLATHFYTRFLDRRNVASALREAMLATRDDLSHAACAHPAAWGPFFVLGDGSLEDDLGCSPQEFPNGQKTRRIP